MNFEFSEEQLLFRDSVRGYLADRWAHPGRGSGALSAAFPQALWSSLAGLGTFAALVPGDFGGLGLTFVDLALVFEEFGRALVAPLVVDTLLATDVLVRHGTLLQKQTHLPAIAAGNLRVCCAIAEADAGYGSGDTMTAVVASGGPARLTGSKMMAAQASAADLLLVSVRLPDGGLGLLLLEPGRPGIQLRQQQSFDTATEYCEVTCREVAISPADMLSDGAPGAAVQRLMDAGAAGAAMLMTGIAGEVLDTTVTYVKQRTQFGRPIGSFQAIKHKCADMLVAVDSSRSAAYYAAWALAEDSPQCAGPVSIAKSYCGDSARLVCNEGIQLHGGMGFTWDLGLHFYLRRCKVLEYSYGDATYHRRRVLAEALRERAVSGSIALEAV